MQTHSLTVVTQNIFGVPFAMNTRARLATIAQELNQAPVDVICLQEVQLTRYIPLLVQSMPNYPHVAYEPFHYAPKGGVMTLSRHPMTKHAFILYDERGWWHTPSLADWMLHKGVLITTLNVGAIPVVVMNTHLIANYDGDWGRTNRYARHQASELQQLIQAVRAQPSQAMVIVAGDFNFPHHTWLHRDFIEATGAFDAMGTERAPTFRTTLPIPLPKLFSEAIDHVFVRPPTGVTPQVVSQLLFADKRRLTSGHHAFVSDHIGIQVRLTWSTPA